jgi:hypothetical protein
MPSIYNTSKSPQNPAVTVFAERCTKVSGKSLNSRELDALNFLVKELLRNNLWNKFKVIYPFVGSNAAMHTLNLRNPFRHNIKWYGAGLRHDRFGVTNTAFGYGNTFFAPSLLSDDNIHISVYNGTFWSTATKNTHTPLIGANTVFDMFPGGSAPRINTEKIKTTAIHNIVLRSVESDKFKRFKTKFAVSNSFTNVENPITDQGFIFTYNCGSLKINENRRSAGQPANNSYNSEAIGLIVGVNGFKCYVCGKPFGKNSDLTDSISSPINPEYTDSEIGKYKIYTQYPFMLFTDAQFGFVKNSLQIGRTNIRFASIGYAMNDRENEIFNDIVQKFQKILLRDVECFTIQESSAEFYDISAYPNLEILEAKRRNGFNFISCSEGATCSLSVLHAKVKGPVRKFEYNELNAAVSVLSFTEEN